MQKIIFGLSFAILLAGCSANPDAPSAPSESSVPKGDGSAPKNSPGVLKFPTRKGGAVKGGGASTPAER